MDIRFGLSLLLLLAYASGAWSTSTRNGPTNPPRPQLKELNRQVHRRTRALSEFLVPPPVPGNFRGPRGPPSPPLQPPVHHNQPPPSPLSALPGPPPKHHPRNGRFVNQHSVNNSNNGPGYFSKLINWLNPFGGSGGAIGKNGYGQAASNFPPHTAQYAPQQPYISGNVQYEPSFYFANLQNGYSGLASWMSGKPCNPCNQIPWIPVVRENFHSNQGQYASNVGNNAYLAPSPPSQEIKSPDFSHVLPVGPTPGNYPLSGPHLYSGPMPPLFKAKPFNDVPASYSAPNLDQPNVDNPLPSNVDQSLLHSSNIEHVPDSNNDNSSPQNFNNLPIPSINYEYHEAPSNFNQRPASNNDHSLNYNSPLPTLNYSPNLNPSYPPSLNNDYSSTNFNQQSSQNFEQHPSPIYDHQQTSNFDYQSSSNFDNHPSSNFEDQHPSSNYEQHHQPSQIVDVVKEPPSDLDQSQLSHHDEPDHAESRPVFVNSATSSSTLNEVIQRETDHYHSKTSSSSKQGDSKSVATVHFQRSPLIDLSGTSKSVTSTIPSNNYHNESNDRLRDRPSEQPVTISPAKGKLTNDNRESSTPLATLIDYIVSSPEEAFGSSEEKKETRPPPSPTRLLQHQSVVPSSSTTTSTTTTERTTTIFIDQRQQESLIETLVQSYEFYKNNDTRTSETRTDGKNFNEGEDFSASREVITPAKSDNGKKNKQIIQIIIPYTSQHTPSPFHSTRTVNNETKKIINGESNSSVNVKEEISNEKDIEDNVVIQESRRVSVTRAPERELRNGSKSSDIPLAGKMGNTIDVHRLQKNIDNWTIQEYSKSLSSVTNSSNSTYPRWLSSKQIPNEYLLSTTENEESSERYNFNNDTRLHRGTNKSEETTMRTENVTKINIINATYPKSWKKTDRSAKRNFDNFSSSDSERVYVVTPIPNPNSLEDLSSEKDQSRSTRARKGKQSQETVSVERAYQVLPQAVNNLAVLSSAPESAAPALWGIMEHEEFAGGSPDQPRWRSESDVLSKPSSTPILYAGHSKVSRGR